MDMGILVMIFCFSIPIIEASVKKPIAGTLIVSGGWNDEGNLKTVQQFDVFDGRVFVFDGGKDTPYSICNGATAQNGNEIFIIGGSTSDNQTAASNKGLHLKWGQVWYELPTLNYERNQATAFVARNTLYVAGGLFGPNYPNYAKIEQLDLNNIDAGWSVAPFGLPFSIWQPASAVIGERIYITDGSYLITYASGDTIWSALMGMSIRRSDHCMVTDGVNRLWVLGGEGTLSVEEYDVEGYRWTMKSPIPHTESVLRGHGCVYHDGYIYVIGGFGDNLYSQTIYSYSTETDTWRFYNVLEPRTELSVGILSWG